MRGTLKDIKFIYCSVCKSLITRSLSDGALIIYSSEQRIVSDIRCALLLLMSYLFFIFGEGPIHFGVFTDTILSIEKYYLHIFFWPKNSWIITSRCQKKLPYLCTQTMHSWYYFSEHISVGQVEVLVIKLNSDIFFEFC